MMLFYLYFSKDLKLKALNLCISLGIPFQLLLSELAQAGWIKGCGLGYRHRQSSVLCVLPNLQLYMNKHL